MFCGGAIKRPTMVFKYVDLKFFELFVKLVY